MPGVDRVVKSYRINADTGERTLNTDFNHFVFLNLIAYIANLVLIITVGAFGVITNTTNILSYSFQSLVTVDELFFYLAWGFIIPWQGFWAIWQIANPSERNCEGVVRAAYYYPLAVLLYGGYTIFCRLNMFVVATVFSYGLCGTGVGLAMSLQRYRPKTWRGYLLWQAPLTLYAAVNMIETMLMTNLLFVRLGETWLIKTIIAAVSVLVIFITAVAWLASYPVDLMIPFVLGLALGLMYKELDTLSHYGNLLRQNYDETLLEGWKYAVLAIFGLVTLMFIIKIIIVMLYNQPKEKDDLKKRRDNKVAISITIDRGAADKDKKKSRNNRSRRNDRPRRSRRTYPEEYAEDYDDDDYYRNDNDYDYDNTYDNHYDNGYDEEANHDERGNYDNRRGGHYDDHYASPPTTPRTPKKKKSSSRKSKNDRDLSKTSRTVPFSPSPSPKKKKSAKTKKKPSSPKKTRPTSSESSLSSPKKTTPATSSTTTSDDEFFSSFSNNDFPAFDSDFPTFENSDFR